MHWNVKVHWVEWRDAKPCFEVVGFNSASRNGEPFAALIAKKNYLPNAITRFCTHELKVRTMRDFCRSLGWDRWVNVVGLRYDEGLRVMKALARNEEAKERFTAVMPLSTARITKRDHIMPFWSAQPFDLELRDYEGNCDLCFLKGRGKLGTIIRENPGIASWWANQERLIQPTKQTGARFVTEYSYTELAQTAQSQGHFFDGWLPEADHDAECGLLCQPEPAP